MAFDNWLYLNAVQSAHSFRSSVHVHVSIYLSIYMSPFIVIFTNSAPLGRVGHRVAMSVCV